MSHPLTADQIAELRAMVRTLASDLGCSLPAAWLSMSTPDYVWAACSAAADAAGPFVAPADDFMNLLAPQSPEREAASRACLDAIKAAVFAEEESPGHAFARASAGRNVR
jgi:hypothetical protein